MPQALPPIARLARRVRRDIEKAVEHFPRFHRYSVGKELHEGARAVAHWVHRAWRDRTQQLAHVRALVLAIDDLKVSMQLAQDVHAFASLRQFEAIYRLVSDLGRQSGGWLKALHSSGQNGRASAPDQRAQKLSSQAAPAGASA